MLHFFHAHPLLSYRKPHQAQSDTAIGLNKLGIKTVRDLLYHFPARYADESMYVSIAHLRDGDTATIRGTVKKIIAKKSWKARINMTEATIEDVSGSIRVVWFNQPYLAKMLGTGNIIELTGKVTLQGEKLSMANPVVREEKALAIDSMDSLFGKDSKGILTPIYPETKGVSSLWFHHAITRALAALETIPDHIPSDILEQYSLPVLKTALIWIHTPKSSNDATIARKRFAFDEIFTINIARQKERAALKEQHAYAIDTSTIDTESFIDRLGFPLTDAQQKAIEHILSDLQRDIPMSRLLEGDVGSGKTAVAAVAAYATVMNRPLDASKTKKQTFGNLQVAYMAPTEILATQHFESFCELFPR